MHYYFDKPRPRKTSPATTRRILVRCPATSKLAPTGRTIDEHLWERAKVNGSRFTCPHCRQVHNWTKKDVILAR